ncbi:unnamed protein product [Somion occarium]|uniref:Uncharacterized protein n=1 Tax=Somion occarium TaxID=3059160 RepID=A0ABP1DPW4_9APHY
MRLGGASSSIVGRSVGTFVSPCDCCGISGQYGRPGLCLFSRRVSYAANILRETGTTIRVRMKRRGLIFRMCPNLLFMSSSPSGNCTGHEYYVKALRIVCEESIHELCESSIKDP